MPNKVITSSQKSIHVGSSKCRKKGNPNIYKAKKSKNILEYVAAKKYKCLQKINSGAFGKVYRGESTRTDEQVAIKIESVKTKHPQLKIEYELYSVLKDGIGIPRVRYFGKEKNYNALVMDLLGPSLSDLFEFCDKKFSEKTILMLTEQMIDRTAYVHSKFYIHRDIKPENFLIGTGDDNCLVYLVDFGLAQLYCDPKTGKHIEFRMADDFCGTLRFASINALKGHEQSRRDDLEAIGYILIYFHRGKLPWERIHGSTHAQKIEKVTERKMSVPLDDLCDGLSDEYLIYMMYCRNLLFDDDPDYKYLRNLFRNRFVLLNYEMDCMFDWMPIKKELCKTLTKTCKQKALTLPNVKEEGNKKKTKKKQEDAPTDNKNDN